MVGRGMRERNQNLKYNVSFIPFLKGNLIIDIFGEVNIIKTLVAFSAKPIIRMIKEW
jgi:hypothetical protein